MQDINIAFLIGLMAGCIFFIDGWGPNEKAEDDFSKSKRFRGLAILAAGGIITPILDYVTTKKPAFFLAYLEGCIYGWFFLLLFGLILYLFWVGTKKRDNKEGFWYKAGDFAYSIIDFIYLGISNNPHINAKRDSDVISAKDQYEQERNYAAKQLAKKLAKAETKPDAITDETKQIVKAYNKEIKKNKTEEDYNFNDWFYKGVDEYEKKEYEKSIAYMKNALEIDSSDPFAPEAHLYIGNSYGNLELYDKGMEQYNLILERYPKYEFRHVVKVNKGFSYKKREKYEEALKEYDLALLEKSDYLDAHMDRAFVLRKLGRLKEAMQGTEAAIKYDDGSGKVWFNIACLYAIENNKANMLTNLTKAIQIDKNYKEIAKTDEDLKDFWNDDEFKKLVA